MYWMFFTSGLRAHGRHVRSAFSVGVIGTSVHAQSQGTGTLIVFVHDEDGPIAQAEVQAGPARGVTGEDGRVTLTVPVGRVDVIAIRAGFDPAAAPIDITPGVESRMDIELQPQSAIEETIVVTSTRAERRIEDEPLRVEVVPAEEVRGKDCDGSRRCLDASRGNKRTPRADNVAVAWWCDRSNSRAQRSLHAGARRWPAAIRRSIRIGGHSSNPPDGPRAGGGHQGCRVRALRHVRDWRRRQSRIASAGAGCSRARVSDQSHRVTDGTDGAVGLHKR